MATIKFWMAVNMDGNGWISKKKPQRTTTGNFVPAHNDRAGRWAADATMVDWLGLRPGECSEFIGDPSGK